MIKRKMPFKKSHQFIFILVLWVVLSNEAYTANTSVSISEGRDFSKFVPKTLAVTSDSDAETTRNIDGHDGNGGKSNFTKGVAAEHGLLGAVHIDSSNPEISTNVNSDHLSNVYRIGVVEENLASFVIEMENNSSLNFGACTWFLHRQLSVSPVLFSMNLEDAETRSNFVYSAYLSVSISQTGLELRSGNCYSHYSVVIDLRLFYHVCVGVESGNITLYFDGNKLSSNGTDCPYNHVKSGSLIAKVNLAKDFSSRQYFVGYLTDFRFYKQIIDQLVVEEALSLNFTTQYLDLLYNSNLNIPNYEFLVASPETLELINTGLEIFVLNDRVNYTSAIRACTSLGGKLYETNSSSINYVKLFVFSVTHGAPINAWVDQQNVTSNNYCPMARIFKDEYSVDTRDCSEDFAVVCRIPDASNFKIIGLRKHPIKLTLLASLYSFESDWDIQLKFDEYKGLLISNTAMRRVLFRSQSPFEIKHIMGRKIFKDKNTFEQKRMTLSACQDHQFTCDDGECIELGSVCNFSGDCLDGSDENFCNTTRKRPEFYNKIISGKLNLPLTLSVKLQRLVGVNINSGTITVQVKLEISWVDERVTFFNVHKNVTTFIPTEDAKFYWQPNIDMSGVVNDDIHIFSLQDNPGKMYVTATSFGTASTYDGYEVSELGMNDFEISHSKGSLVTLACSPDLFIYPFDVQSCHFIMHLKGKVHDDASFQEVFVDSEDDLSSSTYKLLRFKNRKPLRNTKVQFEVRIARQYGSQVLVTFMPCILLQMIGFSVFAVPLEDLGNRLAVSISCLIVMAALFTQITSTLPESPEVKMIDIWMSTHVLQLAVVFLAQFLVYHAHVREEKRPLRIYKNSGNNLADGKVHPEIQKGIIQRGLFTKISDKVNNSNFPKNLNRIVGLLCIFIYAIFVGWFFFYCTIVNNQLTTQE